MHHGVTLNFGSAKVCSPAIINNKIMHDACVCVRVCISVLCRFLQNYYIYRFYTLIAPMNFHTLEIFFGFMDLGLKISE